MGSILVLVETFNGKLRKASLSGVTFARDLASRTGRQFEIGVLGSGIAAVGNDLTGYGAARVHVVDDPVLEHPLACPWSKAIVSLMGTADADYLVVCSSTWSRDVLPRVAASIGAGMVSEAVGMEGNGDAVIFNRPMWAGNVIAGVRVTTKKAVISVRGTEFAAPVAGPAASPVVRTAVTVEGSCRTKFVKFVPTVSERPDLAEAEVVISGGRGLRDKEGFWNTLNPLADLLGAAIGATRAVIDNGIAPNDLQVGQTGKAVAPNLYFAIGLSGAIQHLAGMKNSKVIVAINKDEEAPVFSVADYCLVGDAFKVVPELIEEIKKARA